MTQGASAAIYLLDAHNLIYQVFHAIPGMTAPDGRPTNAVFGFCRDLYYLAGEVRPRYLLCVLDACGPTFRHAAAPEYKAHRPPPPDDLQMQWPLIREALEGFGIPVLEVPGFEADDVIATVASAAAQKKLDVWICTTDKDCRQLIRDRVQLFNLRKQQVLDRSGLLNDWGIAPEQVVDFQALVGDKVDNVSGVAGVGAKTAAKLLQQFGTLDNLLEHLEEVIPARIQKNLKEAHTSGTLALSRQLVQLRTDVPLTMDWDHWQQRGWDAPRLLNLFQELGFRSLAERIRQSLKTAGAQQNAERLAAAGMPGAAEASTTTALAALAQTGHELTALDNPHGTDFAYGALATEDTWQADYRLVNTQAAWEIFLAELRQQTHLAIDLETDALEPMHARIVGYAFCWQEGVAHYVPVRGPLGDICLEPGRVQTALKPVLEDAKIGKINQNIKFDQLVLARHGITLRGVVGDPMLAHYLLHAGERSHNLDELTRVYLGHENIPISELLGKGKNAKTMDQIALTRVCDYACEDADAAWRLTGRLETELEDQQLRTLYDRVEIPLIDVLVQLEANGIRLDTAYLKRLSEEMEQDLQVIEGEIHTLAGHPFNIASPKQLRQVLFEELKLPAQKRTNLTGEASTDQETLEKLAALGHALPRKIIEYRQIQKLKGTYVDALPALVHPETGRLHASFNQTVTATGRLSASQPNLQNIPSRTEQGRQIRQAFLPEPGWHLLTADYSQIELRMLAHYCGDLQLREAFAEDRDIHATVAAEIYKVEPAQVNKEMRRVAKTVNFGVIYGISAHGLSTRLGIPREEAAKFIDAYFARYPKVLEYQNALLKNCRKLGYCSSILGRRRRFEPSAIRPHSKYQQRNQAEREAINMEIQASAADLMKLAMIAVHRQLAADNYQARLLLSVHDELVLEAPDAELQPVAKLVHDAMIGALELEVPLKVDVASGPNWLEVEELAIA